ncbi:MAG TPA: D-alanyl-D-alanine carboxypeptidase family protein, partial [Hyphomicrobiaceae bacterium]|nr:D-alanyl-D-alanine carboxypeptidase family protein [Hyphomicrobiaceae bacterium]
MTVATAGLVMLAPLATPAAAAPRQAALVIDANTGAVISSHEADEPRYPASLTKMMTLYVLFDLVEQGRLTYQSRIRISETAASQPPSKLGLEPGSEISVIDAVKALVTKSANDIAVAVAERIAGSEQKFAALMTQKARAIGMTRTVFRNASGLPDDEQVTTARDMVTLALRLQDDFPKHYPLFATREFRFGANTYQNHNTLLGRYEGIDGIKTGYTRASGFNLVSSVRRGQKHIVGVVIGGKSAASRNQTMRTLLNIGLVRGSNTKTRVPARATAVAARKSAPVRALA